MVLCYCFSVTARAQEVILSEPFKYDRLKQYDIIGKKGNDFLILQLDAETKQRTIQVYDDQMQFKKEYKLDQLPLKAFSLNFITYNNSLTIIFQQYEKDTIFCKAIRLDSNLNILSAPQLLDFSTNSINVQYSQDKSKILVYRFTYANKVVSLSTKIFDLQLQLQHATFSPLTLGFSEVLQSFRIANNGTVYFLIMQAAKQTSNRVNDFEVVYNNFKTTAYKSLLVQVKNKVIDTDLTVEVNNFTHKLLVSTYYYTSNNIDSVAGLFTASVDAVADNATSNFNAFGKNILSQLNKKYARVEEGKHIVVRDIIPQNNGGFVITAEVTLKVVFGSAGQSSRNIITDPRELYDPVYFPNRSFGGDANVDAGNFPDPMKRGRSAGINGQGLLYDDIIVAYFDENMKLSSSFVVPKKQAYKYLSADKLSFLTLNNGRQINILFNAGSVRNNLIYNKSFSATGESSLRPTLKIKDDHNILIPWQSKQVALNQALLAFSYKGKLRFGRFDF